MGEGAYGPESLSKIPSKIAKFRLQIVENRLEFQSKILPSLPRPQIRRRLIPLPRPRQPRHIEPLRRDNQLPGRPLRVLVVRHARADRRVRLAVHIPPLPQPRPPDRFRREDNGAGAGGAAAAAGGVDQVVAAEALEEQDPLDE